LVELALLYYSPVINLFNYFLISDLMASSNSGGGAGATAAPRPVFVFPGALDFYLEDQTTHKRVLTIYNPFDVDIFFKVLCNNPKKYAVVEPEGRILGQKCADIVVRHVGVSPAAVQQTDKFRIHIYDEGSTEVAGKRDVLATLHPGSPDPGDSKHGSSLPHRPAAALESPPGGRGPHGVTYYNAHNGDGTTAAPVNYIACFAAVVCIAALFLPTEGEPALADYPYLQLTVNQKLVFAYVLGLVTMAILRAT